MGVRAATLDRTLLLPVGREQDVFLQPLVPQALLAQYGSDANCLP